MLQQKIKNKLVTFDRDGLIRKRYQIHKRNENYITLADGKTYLNFSSNDYLGLANHPEVKKAAMNGIEQYGLGSGASAMVSGFYNVHALLEKTFARILNKEKALLFSSGYVANLAVFTSLSSRYDCVISDKLCHASILDGIQLARMKNYRYKHQNVAHANELLKGTNANAFVVSESVFSMEGDITPIHELSEITSNNNAILIIDDAHGFGVLQESARQNVEKADLIVVPFGKSLGSMGAIVAGSSLLIDTITQFARVYRYGTAPPPGIHYGTLKALELLQKETWRKDKLKELIIFFNLEAQNYGLKLASYDETAIRTIIIGGNTEAMQMKEKLLQEGYFVGSIRPPSVPKNTARLRITLNANHNKAQIKTLLKLIYTQHQTL